MLKGPAGAGTMNGFIGAMVSYITGDRIILMLLYKLPRSVHGMETVFAFSCRTMLCSAVNVGSPLIQVRYWCSK